jgi:hypothetical protein
MKTFYSNMANLIVVKSAPQKSFSQKSVLPIEKDADKTFYGRTFYRANAHSSQRIAIQAIAQFFVTRFFINW